MSVLEQPFGKALKYFCGLVTFSTLVWAVVVLIWTAPTWSTVRSEATALRGQVIDVFPDDLVLTFSKGELSTNQPQPSMVAFPAAWALVFQDAERGMPAPRNLVVFDTTKPLDRTDFSKQDTLVLVSKTEIGFYDPRQGRTDIRNFGSGLKDGSVDKTMYVALVNGLWGWLWKAIPVFVVLLIPLTIIATIIGNLMYLFFGALAVWLGAMLVGKRLVYTQAYKAGLYLLTFPTLIAIFVQGVPFFTTIALLALAMLNFRSKSEQEPQTVTQKKVHEDVPKALPDAVLVEELK